MCGWGKRNSPISFRDFNGLARVCLAAVSGRMLCMWPREKACRNIRQRVREVARSFPSNGRVVPLLHSPSAAPSARLSDASGCVPAPGKKEKVTFLMGTP